MPDAFQPARTYKSKKKHEDRNKRKNTLPKGTEATRKASRERMRVIAAELRAKQEKKRKESAKNTSKNKKVLKARPRIPVVDRMIDSKKMSPSAFKKID